MILLTGGGSASVHAGIPPLRTRQASPGPDTPLGQTAPSPDPPGLGTPGAAHTGRYGQRALLFHTFIGVKDVRYPLLVKVFKLLYQTPGPGTYNISSSDGYKKKAPVYSLGSRYLLPGDNTHKPGPGSHCPEKVGFRAYRRLHNSHSRSIFATYVA